MVRDEAAFVLVLLSRRSLTTTVVLAIVSQVLQAFGWSVWAIHQGSTRQILVPPRLQGRVNGSFLFLVRGATSIGGFAGGVLVAWAGVTHTLVIGALGSSLSVAWLVASPLWKLRTRPAPVEDSEMPLLH